jgi:hypothetical protein
MKGASPMKLISCPALLLFTFSSCIALSACAPFSPNSSHAGMCNELNSRMIFNGSTSNIRKAEIEDADEPLVERTYDKKCEGQN